MTDKPGIPGLVAVGWWDHALSPEEMAREHKRVLALIAERKAAGINEVLVERNGVRIEAVNPSPVRVTYEGTANRGKTWFPVLPK